MSLNGPVPALLPEALDYVLAELARCDSPQALIDLLSTDVALAQILLTVAQRHEAHHR
jgi:hypothetical protein